MTAAVDRAADGPRDAVLLAAVRRGDIGAFGVLYERHLGAARRLATTLVAAVAEREDLVAEAFTRVLRALRTGNGPTEEFRPYLFVTLRNTVISRAQRVSDPVLYGTAPDQAIVTTNADPISDRASAAVVAQAFASLPERWRTVLWHTEVEGESPAQIASLLGMTPNGVSALAYRAREGLRQAYLQQHLPSLTRPDCQAVAPQLSAWVRHRQPANRKRRITTHLSVCSQCRGLADILTAINNELPSLLAPVILGASAASAYLAATSVSSGAAVLATAAKTTVPWLTAIKTAVAGAMIVTTATITTVASDPVSDPREPHVALAPPTTPAPATTDVPTRPRSPNPSRPVSPPLGTPPTPTDTPAAGPTTTSTEPAPTSEKQAVKAAKQATKAAKKEEKAEKKTVKGADRKGNK